MIKVNYMFRPKWSSSGLRSKVSWRIHSNPVKKYHYTFERKPDDDRLGRNM